MTVWTLNSGKRHDFRLRAATWSDLYGARWRISDVHLPPHSLVTSSLHEEITLTVWTLNSGKRHDFRLRAATWSDLYGARWRKVYKIRLHQ